MATLMHTDDIDPGTTINCAPRDYTVDKDGTVSVENDDDIARLEAHGLKVVSESAGDQVAHVQDEPVPEPVPDAVVPDVAETPVADPNVAETTQEHSG